MSNHLSNGTILPSGLLGISGNSAAAGFNKIYKNSSLRVGIVVATHSISDDTNYSKLSTEYDVSVFEQNENTSCTNIIYKNCLSVDGLGSIADFFEKTLRSRKATATKGESVNTSGQDGAVVLLLCLDGVSDKGIVVGALCHPDRKTTLVDSDPRLEGEYNGVNVEVNSDGSTSLTFNGATDNQGTPTDPSQGTTAIKIEKDGSFQVNHDKITLRLDRSGDATVTAKGNVIVNCTNATVTATDIATVEGKTVKLGKDATEAVIKGDTFAKLYNNHVHIGNLGVPTGAPLDRMDPSLSKKVKTE